MANKLDISEELYQISKMLFEADEALAKARLDYFNVNTEYQKAVDDLLLSPETLGLGSQPLREAEVRKRMALDHAGLSEKNSLALDALINAKNRYESIKEKSSNLRAIAYAQKQY